jgi:hypothetical protein
VVADDARGAGVAEKRKKKKADVVPITLRIPRDQKAELDELVERLPGGMSLNSLLLQMIDSSVPMIRETVKMFEMMKNAPNPSMVVERMDAFLDEAKRDASTYAGTINTVRREVAAQEEAERGRE